MGLHPDVAAIRLAVRRTLADSLPPTATADDPATAVVACSGGADSLALLAATVFETRRLPWRVFGATVDHGLQADSAAHAEHVVAQMAELGADETLSARVQVRAEGQGPEAAAREARYAVLEQVAESTGAIVVLLGHTLDDQAETVLLGLTRGSGGRSIAGMRRGFGPFRRPLLDLRRAQTEAACAAEGIAFWSDPHNEDPRYTRSRVRRRVMPVLEDELGPGVAETLARTGELLREDMELLDDLADELLATAAVPEGLRLDALTGQPDALVGRVLRRAALAAGCPAAELFRVHVLALADIAFGEAGGRQAQLPGHVTAWRADELLHFGRTAAQGGRGPVAG